MAWRHQKSEFGLAHSAQEISVSSSGPLLVRRVPMSHAGQPFWRELSKTRADFCAANEAKLVQRQPSPPFPLRPRQQSAHRPQRRANTLDKDEDDRGNGNDDAREAREKRHLKRHKENRACALEQRMEEKFCAQVEERKQRAAAKTESNALDAETQWRNQIDSRTANCYVGPRCTCRWECWDTTEEDTIQQPRRRTKGIG